MQKVVLNFIVVRLYLGHFAQTMQPSTCKYSGREPHVWSLGETTILEAFAVDSELKKDTFSFKKQADILLHSVNVVILLTLPFISKQSLSWVLPLPEKHLDCPTGRNVHAQLNKIHTSIFYASDDHWEKCDLENSFLDRYFKGFIFWISLSLQY